MAQSRYAMGAVAPSVAAMSAGSRKMPPPIVTLTMLAASAKVPMDRRRDDSDDEARVGSVKVTNLSEGLRPSDSPTRALARRFAGALDRVARSPSSLAP